MQTLGPVWISWTGLISPPLRDALNKGACLVGQASTEESGHDLSLRSAVDQAAASDLQIDPYLLNEKHARFAKYVLVLAFVGYLATG